MFQHPAPLHYAKTGRGQQVATFPWLSSDFSDAGTSAVGFALGSPWYDEFGNSFLLKFNTAAGALAFGNTTIWATTAVDAVAAAPAPTVRAFGAATGFGLAANAEVGNWIYNLAKGTAGGATGIDSLKQVKASAVQAANQLITISVLDTKVSNLQADADAYAAVPVAAQGITMIRPHAITIFPTAGAAISKSQGIATGAVVASHYCFIQRSGLALVTSTGAGTALVMGSPAVPSGANAGNVIGAAACAANQVGTCAAATAAAAGGVSPIWLEIEDSNS